MDAHDPRHGSNAGYLAHYRSDKQPCADCKAARSAYIRKRRQEKPRAPRYICASCLHQRARRSGGTCSTCIDEVTLTGGRWVLDPVRRIQVWESAA